MRKLPSVYKNTTVKSTNKKMFYSRYESPDNLNASLAQEAGNIYDTSQILEKINTLFQRRKHTYTDEVEIKTKDKTLKTRLVFMTNEKIVTIDNEDIYLDDITSIQI